MPKNKYQKSKIYKLVCNITDNIYISYTTQELRKRKYDHCREYNEGVINEVTDIIKNGDFRIELIENFPCDSLDELKKRTFFHIDCINKEKIKKKPIKKNNAMLFYKTPIISPIISPNIKESSIQIIDYSPSPPKINNLSSQIVHNSIDIIIDNFNKDCFIIYEKDKKYLKCKCGHIVLKGSKKSHLNCIDHTNYIRNMIR